MREIPFAVVFPGQGSQELGMADSWAAQPVGRAVFDEASDAIARDIVADCQNAAALETTEFVQPALLACEIAAYRVIAETRGIPFSAAAGHSLGHFASLVAAEVLTLGEALKIVSVRGRAMQAASEAYPGGMLALLGRVDEPAARRLCEEAAAGDELTIANLNAPGQIIVSGTHAAITRAESLAAGERLKTVRLNTAGAFHSELMRPAVAPIIDAMQGIEFRPPIYPVADNVTGTLVSDPVDLRSNLERHVVSPVRWEESVRALGHAGVKSFVEVGPGKKLSGLIKKIARSKAVMHDVKVCAVTAAEDIPRLSD